MNATRPGLIPAHAKIGGKARRHPADFRVDEVPAYEAHGEGEHLFVRFEKVGLSTPVAVTRLAEALRCDPKSAGWAGLKDRWAVTTQWASFHRGESSAASRVALSGIRVLEARRHPHKLRVGHLRGNRFELRIIDVPPAEHPLASRVLAALDKRGMPNFYGDQRFAMGNLPRAQAWLLGRERPPRTQFERRLLMSTLQAAMFNDWLGRRLREGHYERPVAGDLMRKEETGGLFVAENLPDASQRMKAWLLSPTGPIFGAKMRPAGSEARARELQVLADWGLDERRLNDLRRWGAGSRRPMRVRPQQWQVEPLGQNLRLSFFLPAGSYATVLLGELLRAPDMADPRSSRPEAEVARGCCSATANR